MDSGEAVVAVWVGSAVGAEVAVGWDWVQATNKNSSVSSAMVWRKCLLQAVLGWSRTRPLLDS